MTDTEKPVDPTELAKRLLDLWQDQLAAMAADRDLAQQMARLSAALMQPPPTAGNPGGPHNMMFGTWPAGTATTPGGAVDPTTLLTDWWKQGMNAWSDAIARQMPPFTSAQGDQRAPSRGTASPAGGSTTGTAPTSTPVGTAPAAAASQPGPDDLEQLRRHLAKLDARLAELEGTTPGSQQPEPERRPPAKHAGESQPASAAAAPATAVDSGAGSTGAKPRRSRPRAAGPGTN